MELRLLQVSQMQTLTCSAPAMIPSTVDSAKRSKRRSLRRMNSGFNRYPLRPLYSNRPRFSCIGRSNREHMNMYWRSNVLLSCTGWMFCCKFYRAIENWAPQADSQRSRISGETDKKMFRFDCMSRDDVMGSNLRHVVTGINSRAFRINATQLTLVKTKFNENNTYMFLWL